MSENLAPLRNICLTALFAGTVGSVALTLYVGRSNSSRLLLGMFVLWVLSPFALLAAIARTSKRWSAPIRTTLYSLMMVLALATLLIYAQVAFGRPRAQKAFAFVIVPGVSWLVTGIVMGIAVLARRSMQAR
jgi:hypothetical protein